jgi:uncharacterized protein (DUF1778 family)
MAQPKREKRLQVKVTEDEYEAIQEAATRHGQTLSTYVRMVLLASTQTDLTLRSKTNLTD